MSAVQSHERRWFPKNQTQTLEIAAALLYWNAVLGILIGLIGHGYGAHLTLLFALFEAGAAFGIANERRWGYYLALGCAVPALIFTLTSGFLGGGLFDFIFQLALVGLLVHPRSSSYVKTWFH